MVEHKRLRQFGIIVGAQTPVRPDGQAYVRCPQCSDSRKKANKPCLGVNIRKGLWKCHHCGWKTPGVNTQRVVRAKNVRPGAWWHGGRTADGRAPVAPKERRIVPLSAHWRRFLAQRGIDPDFAQTQDTGQTMVFNLETKKREAALCFSYRRRGEVRARKFRFAEKAFQLEAGCERMLFGVDSIAETTIIVEGELDRLACLQAGINAVVSVPDGAPTPDCRNLARKLAFLDADASRLAQVQRFIIASDDDAPGHRLAQALIARLGAHRCHMPGGGALPAYPHGRSDLGAVLRDFGPSAVRSAAGLTDLDCTRKQPHAPAWATGTEA